MDMGIGLRTTNHDDQSHNNFNWLATNMSANPVQSKDKNSGQHTNQFSHTYVFSWSVPIHHPSFSSRRLDSLAHGMDPIGNISVCVQAGLALW